MFHRSMQAHPAGSGKESGCRRPAPAGWPAALDSASQACCCPAQPAVVAVMPSAPGRPRQVELLLCRHHYRVSRQVTSSWGTRPCEEAAG